MMSSSIRLENERGQVADRAVLEAPVELHSQPEPERVIIRRRDDSGSAPLSFGQERLWFLEQIAPGDASGNISRGLKITGELNYDLLRRSLQTVVSRHETLRTRFATTQLYAGVDSQPAQFIANSSV